MDLGLRQSDVTRRLGVYTSTVNTWENGQFTPDVRFVPAIVGFLGYAPFGPPPTSFPAWLKAARIAAGLTRRSLAARTGVHPGTVAEWERGQAWPMKASLRRLRALLGMSEEH
jgi:transcriptional regulator with XRE-family HTH domain